MPMQVQICRSALLEKSFSYHCKGILEFSKHAYSLASEFSISNCCYLNLNILSVLALLEITNITSL